MVLCKGRFLNVQQAYEGTNKMQSKSPGKNSVSQLYTKVIFACTRSHFLLKRTEKVVADSKIEINPHNKMHFICNPDQIIGESEHGKVREFSFKDMRES